ncbi:MAG: DUF3887 domain-containing protein [Planctomycetota bacterium]|jgi:hypothetical protein
MPAAKRRPNNAMLYTVITLVALLIISTTIAVIFYIKAENNRTTAETLQSQMDDLATSSELRRIGTLIGTKQPRKTRLATMVEYLDKMVYLILGGMPEETSAEVKVDNVDTKTKDIFELFDQQTFETTAPEQKAPDNEFVKLLVDGQFQKAVESFDETMKNALPPDNLQLAWNAVISQAGAFKQQLGLRTGKEDEFDAIFVTCQFENSPLDVKLVYNNDKKIVGLFFVPTPPEVLQTYQATSQSPAEKTAGLTIDDPNDTGLFRIIEKLNINLNNTSNAALKMEQQFNELQKQFNDAMEATREKEQTLLAEKEKYEQQYYEIENNYNELKAFMEQTTEQQVQTLYADLDKERANSKELNSGLLRTQAELKIAQGRIKQLQQQSLVPPPDTEVQAYLPDGKIILLDDYAKVVHLNIGSDDRVYQGLTFSVYDKSVPIPKDGKGKAEIEVFNVGKNISSARIISPVNNKRPILLDDIVANLVWDSKKKNVFVVAGDFDLDGNGMIDYDGANKIKALIEKWGGIVENKIAVNTDFLILGQVPKILKKPTFEEMERDPLANQRYETSLQRLTRYKDVQTQAQALSIPVFNTERFLYFIGYKNQAAMAGSF